VDVWEGDDEPMIFHGKTLTSKVSLREVCNAIAKYAFVTSPYPILISAEVHCGVAQQEKLVDIMTEAFGESLIQAPVDGRPPLTKLPSPEDLKHKILLKVWVVL
jgi:phosphatidylinositol phospholipase C delta